MRKPTVIDLFAGAGGLSLGFEMAGFNVVLANEYDESIAAAYVANHPKTKMIVGDIAKIDFNKVFLQYKNKTDVIIGGPPCQGFSQKGKRKSINDPRNFLFKQFVRAVEFVKPKYFVMENVPNLLTTEKGLFKNEIYELFSKIGYKLQSGILNAADFGVPQNRHRAVIIGKLDSNAPDLPKALNIHTTVWEAISDLNYLNSGEGKEQSDYIFDAKTDYQRMMRKNSQKLYNHVATKHSLVSLERLAMIPPGAGKEVLPKEHRTKSIYSGTWTRIKPDSVSVTITTRFDTPSSGEFTHPFLNRALTVREAARLQSFPDTFIFLGKKSSQMKQVGNAVPPLLAKHIALTILKDMKKDNKIHE